MIIIGPIFLGVLAFFFDKYIRKYSVVLGVLIALISLVSLFWYNDFTGVFVSGEIGLSFYLVVMFAGAFPKQSRLTKKLKSVRKEYSIWGLIALIPHLILFLIDFITGAYPWEVVGVIAALIMIPLFITSFQRYKKKMKIKDWQKLQKLSYLVYALIFVHLILTSAPEHQVIYIFIFSAYLLLKLNYYLFNNKIWVRRSLTLATLLVTIFTAHNIITTESIYFSFFGVNSSVDASVESESMTDGTFTGTAVGYTGELVVVKVSIENGEIIDIDLLDCGCTLPSHGMDYEVAAEAIADSVINLQTTDIDAISGATTTSHSVIEAIKDAIEQSYQ